MLTDGPARLLQFAKNILEGRYGLVLIRMPLKDFCSQ